MRRRASPRQAAALPFWVALAVVALPAAARGQTCYIRPFDRVGDTWHCTAECDRSTPHAGVDFPVASGSAVPAIADGVAHPAPYSDCLGNVLTIEHPDGMWSGYAHLSAIHVGEGQPVARGQHVADVGATGTCQTGPHLHLTLGDHQASYYDRNNVDPLAYIDAHAACTCRTDNGHFSWACDGPIDGRHCISLNEPDDPDSWVDNYLCTPTDEGVVFSTGGPVEGMRCASLYEAADAHAESWADDAICTPADAPYDLSWSSAGPLGGWSCVQFLEPSDPGTWGDNFLCERPRTCFGEGGLTFCGAGPLSDTHCVSLDEPGDPDTWTDNYLCVGAELGGEALGLRFSAAGPLSGMDCLHIGDAAEPGEVWADDYLCLPTGAPVRLSWSEAGRLPGLPCARFYEASDLLEGWGDNYLCLSPAAPPPDAAGPDTPAPDFAGIEPPPTDGRDAASGAVTADAAPDAPERAALVGAQFGGGCDCAVGDAHASATPWLGPLVVWAIRRRRRPLSDTSRRGAHR